MKQLTLFKDMGETRSKQGYMFNNQGRECSKCGEFKLWSLFYNKGKKSLNSYLSRCKSCESFVRKQRLNDTERIKLFNNIERKYQSGDVREDGMIFKEYAIGRPPKKNFEYWVTKEVYERYQVNLALNRKKIQSEFQKIERPHKRGDVRSDGMKFWEYGTKYTGFEKWATEDEFERLRFNSNKKNYMKINLGKFGGKDEPADKIVGLNDYDLMSYIESLFQEGMTWKNRGNWEGKWNPKKPKWHLDHIIPLDAANTLEEAKILWHYTNLRPMWGNKNLAKSNKHCKKELAAYLEERKAAK